MFLYWLRRPAWLAMAPMLILNSFTWYEAARLPFFSHYSAPIVAWGVVGAVDGLRSLARSLAARRALRWRPLLAAALLMACAATNVMQGYLPWSRGFVWPVPLRSPDTVEIVLAHIPPEATVSAGIHLAPRLARRETLRFFPDLRGATWIAVDLWFWGDPYGIGYEVWREVLRDPQWETVAAQDGLVVLRRGAGPPANIGAALTPTGAPLSPLAAQFGLQKDALQLQGAQRYAQPFGHFIFCTEWQSAGGAYTSQIIVGADAAAAQPLASTRLIPDFLRQPGRQRDCTPLSAASGLAETTLGLHVLNADGEPLSTLWFNSTSGQ